MLVGSLLLACSASAEEVPSPVWTECVKAATRSGVYPNKECKLPSKAGKGKYIIKEGLGRDKPLKGSPSKAGPIALYVSDPLAEGGVTAIICKTASVSGNYALPDFVTDVKLGLRKCSFGAYQACSSTGAAPGEIEFSMMVGEYGYTEVKPPGEHYPYARVTVGLRLASESDPGGVIVQFACGGELEGSVSNEVIFNVARPDLFFSGEGGLGAEPDQYTFLEQELAGRRFVPKVNVYLGWASELPEIEAGERRPHLLEAELCGSDIEGMLGSRCTPPLYAAINVHFQTHGEALMLETPSSFECLPEIVCRPGGP